MGHLGSVSSRSIETIEETDLDTSNACNERAIRTLARAIAFSSQRFSLILVRCNHDHLRRHALHYLQSQYAITPQTLDLPKTTISLYNAIQQRAQMNPPSSLMVMGLETALYLDELLISTNQMRNEFRLNFHFPLVLWVNDETVQKLIKLAPDFYSWASAPINLELCRSTD